MRLVTLDDVPDGEVVAVDAPVDGDVEPVIVLRDGATARAWLNVCPHAGRRLDWSPGRFLRAKDGSLVCAAHGATFELGAGLCTAGPCRGESLRTVDVEVREGAVWLRTAG